MSYLKLISEVLEKNLCTRCGACVAVCPSELLHLDEVDPLCACIG